MNRILRVFIVAGLALLLSGPAFARVRLGIGLWFPWFWAPYPYPYPAATTVVVQQPASANKILIADPDAMQAGNAEDYAKMLADFHDRMRTDKNLLKRQLEKGGLTREQYENDMKSIDQIAANEHKMAAQNNGSLTGDQIIDLMRQLEKCHEQILKDLQT